MNDEFLQCKAYTLFFKKTVNTLKEVLVNTEVL